MAKFFIRVLLNGDFKPIFVNRNKVTFDKKLHYKLLRESVINMFSKLFYPLNMHLSEHNVLDFELLKISKQGILIHMVNELETLGNYNVKELESDLRKYNLHPDFLKYVKILNVLK